MRGCFPRVLLLGLVHLLPLLPLQDALRSRNEDDQIISNSSEKLKPRRWSEMRDGPYQMIVTGREIEELEAKESMVYVPRDLSPKKTSKSGVQKSETKVQAVEKERSDVIEHTTTIKEVLTEKYDKVTQRIILKHGRKRLQSNIGDTGNTRKPRRNPVVNPVTTPNPHTMSYNLYNHFRPLEQDVPQDHILPFLDFGRKLTTGPPQNAMNTIEGISSTHPSVTSLSLKKEGDNLFHENADETLMKKAVERNTVPQEMPQLKDTEVSSYYKKKMQNVSSRAVENNSDLTTTTVHPLVKKLLEKRLSANETESDSNVFRKTIENSNKFLNLSIGLFDTINKTELQNVDLQSHETQNKASKVEVPITKDTQESNLNIKTDNETIVFVNVSGNAALFFNETEDVRNISNQSSLITLSEPNPTAKILSTAVVTSVSIKEVPNNLHQIKNGSDTNSSNYFPIIIVYNDSATNYNTSEITFADLKARKLDNNSTRITSSLLNQRRENYTLLFNHQIHNKSKSSTSRLKPTFRPVTFRAPYRRNLTKIGPPVIRVISTPHSYIEVPKILTATDQDTLIISSTDEALKNRKLSNNETLFKVQNLNITIIENATDTITNSSYKISSTAVPSTTDSLLLTTLPVESEVKTIASSLETPTTKVSVVTHQTVLSSKATSTERPVNEPNGVTEMDSTDHSEFNSDLPELTESPSYHNESNESVTFIESKWLDLEKDVDFSKEAIDNTTYNNSQVEYTTITYHSSTEAIPKKAVVKEDSNTTNVKPGFTWYYNKKNWTVTKSVENVDIVYPDTIGIATYILAVLGAVPLILGAFVLVRQMILKRKKKVGLDESEYSSEYNRTPLPTKLPRLPAHINWETEKPPSVPTLCKRWEFSREKLRLQTLLGQGNFGQVWKAEADDISGHEGLTRLVAVKTVKEGASLREKEDLLRELGIMQDLGAHPNVVTLLGCCTEKEPYLLIMEYVMYGKLLAFLREHRTRAHYFNFSDLSSALTSRDLTVFAYCVSRGMEYLVTKGIIHRDLAARNVLVDHNKLCKIADFGMSRNVRDTGQIYEQRPNKGALPIRWMAPESLQFSLFTHKADVWSFGILLWEIITLGSTPYSTMGAREVMRRVKEGYRLEKPKHCKVELYKVATKCWNYDPSKRPTFSDLRQDLAALLGDKETGGGYVDLEAMAEETNE